LELPRSIEVNVRQLLRSILAVFVGLLTGGIVIAGIQSINLFTMSTPAPDPFKHPKEFDQFIANAPASMFLVVLLAYIVGPFIGGWVAARLAPSRPIVHGMIIGVFFLLAGISNLMQFTHPLWFAIASMSVFLPMAFLGAWCGGRNDKRGSVTVAA